MVCCFKKSRNKYVFISRAYYTEDKVRDTFNIMACNWIGDVPTSGNEYSIKVRHGVRCHKGTVTKLDDQCYMIKLQERDQGIAAGQFAVIYDGTQCLGGWGNYSV